MALPAQTNVPELVAALINAWFTYWRLQRLDDMVDRQYDLADRQTALAELLYSLHKTLRARDQKFFNFTNNSLTYLQRYGCAMLRANVNTARELAMQRQMALRSTSAYHRGQMRNIAQLTANSMVTLGMPKKLDAYRFEDALVDTLQEQRFANLVNSISTRLFSPGRVYASLGAYYERMTDTLSRSSTRFIEDTAYHLGRAYEGYFGDRERRASQKSADMFSMAEERRRLEIASGEHINLQAERGRLRIASGEHRKAIESYTANRVPYRGPTPTEEEE